MRSGSLLLFLFIYSFSWTQNPDYLFPINPGHRNYLAGTMGELRGNHFHAGLDIRTGGREGLPVYAIADGYVFRVKISSGGYGHAVYIKHYDGNTSVYGHLQKFEDKLEDYVRARQYEEESYEIEFFPQKGQFEYEKGDVIAYSGNTGSSSGPHLHFEIRDENQRYMNPLNFGFSEIIDNMIPVAKRIAFVTLNENARINDAFGRYEFDLIYVKDKFTTRKPIELKGRIGIEIYHYDFSDGSWARNGIPEVTATINKDTIFRQVKNVMSFGLNRHINVHMNYPNYVYRRTKFNKLYLDDGNQLDIYLENNRGFNFKKDKEYELEIFMRDNFDNVSRITSDINSRRVVYPESPSFNIYDIENNFIHFRSEDSTATVYSGYTKQSVAPYTSRKKKGNYFLWDLRKGLPDSISISEEKIRPHFQVAIPPGLTFEFFNTNFDLKSYRRSLFDTLYLRFSKEYDSTHHRELFSFKNIDVPLKRSVKIKLKSDRVYDDTHAVYKSYGSRLSYVTSEKNESGQFSFHTRNFSTYTIASDTIPPIIVPYSWSGNNLRVKIFDEMSGIKSYRATLNGEFLLMHYDAKKDMLRAVPENPNLPVKGKFILEIEDNLGNKSKIERTL